MARQRELSLMIAVKAAPVPTAQLQESMCVPGIDLGSVPGGIRLSPIPFRDLADDSKFRKYEEVTLHAKRSTVIGGPSRGYRSRDRSGPAVSSELNTAGRLDVTASPALASGTCVI